MIKKTPGLKNHTSDRNLGYIKKIHTFGITVDGFIAQWGIKQETPDRLNPEKTNDMILIPGSYQFNNGEKEVEKGGVFIYIINQSLRWSCHM